MASIAENHSTETFDRWRPFWFGITDNILQHFISIDMGKDWRSHLIWSKPEGEELRRALTQKFSSTTVLLSVILAAEIGVLTSPSKPADNVRLAFKAREYNIEYWAGMALGWAIFFSIGAVIANYTAWSLFAAISDENLKMIARSSLGVYCAQLPMLLIVFTAYMFFFTIVLFWFVLMPKYAALGLSMAGSIFLCYMISTYSALGSLVMHSGALGPEKIVSETIEQDLTPLQISEELMRLKKKTIREKTKINQQYADIKFQNLRRLKALSLKEMMDSHHSRGLDLDIELPETFKNNSARSLKDQSARTTTTRQESARSACQGQDTSRSPSPREKRTN